MMINGVNGTCYSQNEYDKIMEENDENESKDWIIAIRKEATESENIGVIQNCDKVLRYVKNELPSIKEMSEGSKAVNLKLKEDGGDWKLKGGLPSKYIDSVNNEANAMQSFKSTNPIYLLSYFIFIMCRMK